MDMVLASASVVQALALVLVLAPVLALAFTWAFSGQRKSTETKNGSGSFVFLRSFVLKLVRPRIRLVGRNCRLESRCSTFFFVMVNPT